jgi:hypothetical protein
MTDRAEELSPLAPTPLEMCLTVVSLAHVMLVVLVVVQLLRGKMTLPHGVFGLIVLLAFPVIGPVLVLTWRGRVERGKARSQHAVA